MSGLSLLNAAYDSDLEDETVDPLVSFDAVATHQHDQLIAEETLSYLLDRVCQVHVDSNGRREVKQTKETFANFRTTKNDDEINLSSDSESSSSDSSDEDSLEVEEEKTVIAKIPVKTKGELGIEDLPPIEHLHITAPVEHLVHIGRVKNIMECLVTVQSFKNMPALDQDSVLFLRDGKPLGAIFEVFGQVIEPYYLVRYNSAEEIADRGIAVDMPVYYATNFQAPVTAYVFIEQLRKLKGTDASWKHNNEPPEGMKEYSDDEEERRDKMKAKAKRKTFRNVGKEEIPRSSGFASPSSIPVPPNTPANSLNGSKLTNFQRRQKSNWFAANNENH
ncbi:H/ACA ribonucleoprotein complex non-core subunit NAF1 [Halotydeus destructor]|nr:H/ACA ribonucleoprotein complex non-core subunit NAF1 [Halotydeus destructor]